MTCRLPILTAILHRVAYVSLSHAVWGWVPLLRGTRVSSVAVVRKRLCSVLVTLEGLKAKLVGGCLRGGATRGEHISVVLLVRLASGEGGCLVVPCA